MRRSTYDNSYNRNRTRIDGRDSGNWATRLGVRNQHKDMRGRVIGGIAADGTGFGTKSRSQAPAPAATTPSPVAAPPKPTAPKAMPRPSGIEAATPKIDPLRSRIFPDRAAATPENKLTKQIATNTPGARTSNINRLTGKPMGWRPGDDVAANPAAPKSNIEPMGPPAPAKQAPGWVKATMPKPQGPPAPKQPTQIQTTPIASLDPSKTSAPSQKQPQPAAMPSPTKSAPPAARMPTPAPTPKPQAANPPARSQPSPTGRPIPAGNFVNMEAPFQAAAKTFRSEESKGKKTPLVSAIKAAGSGYAELFRQGKKAFL